MLLFVVGWVLCGSSYLDRGYGLPAAHLQFGGDFDRPQCSPARAFLVDTAQRADTFM
jgi:hypothetical protein